MEIFFFGHLPTIFRLQLEQAQDVAREQLERLNKEKLGIQTEISSLRTQFEDLTEKNRRLKIQISDANDKFLESNRFVVGYDRKFV